MFKSILVVCVGNICRSPMAEALLRSHAPESVRVESAGIGALVGEAADPSALRLMQERSIDISAHRARQFTPEMARRNDLILVMEDGHRQHIHSIAAEARGKVHMIGKWGDMEIPDPYKKSPEYFEYVLGLIEQGVDQWSSKLWV
ncbi:MAG: low molecular weight protein-tyrosine-phosphatase [Mariprofundus sp.]|nr:low molecular weight protein-tyrosine-phosphatase [Mariprofundus sp.]